MKTSPLALAVFLGAVGSDFSVDAAVLSAAGRIAPSPSLFTKSKTLLSKLNPRAIYPTATAIGRDVAATLASRRLLINQDEAAKKVRDAVAAANQAVDNGETSGVALPLDYVKLSDQVGGQQQLTVRLRLPGVDRDLNVLIDTGSSSLAFCDKDKSLINEAKNIKKTTYAQCNEYSHDVSCPDGSTGSIIAYAGQIFSGDVAVYTDQGEMFASMDNVSFAIMELAQIYTCFGPLDGIIGVAYDALNRAVELPSPDFDVSSLWNEFCQNPNQADFSSGYKTIGKCDSGNMTKVTLTSPLKQALDQDYISGQITAAAFGLYLDYAATMGSKVDTVVPSLGIYFGGDLAYDNQFYNNGKVQVAKTISYLPYNGDFYGLYITSIRVPALNLTQSTVDLCEKIKGCFTDTGNSWLELPLPQEYCNALCTGVDELKEAGSLFIDLTAADGKDDITLSFPLLWLAEQFVLGHVECTGTTGRIVLGLPIHQYYYTVYDMGNDTISFVELNLSNETQAFLDGPELGGLYPPKNEEPEEEAADGTTASQPTLQPTSMGCFRHKTSLSLLAWTVFVPSAIALIASI